MKQYELAYGKASRRFTLPDRVQATVIEPVEPPGVADPNRRVAEAIAHPLNFTWRPLRRDETVAITVNDKTRPVPNHLLLPPLLDWLKSHGVDSGQIEFWIASGSHKPMSRDEYARILPQEITETYRVRPHDIDDLDNLVQIGATTRGTPVIVNKAFREAGLKIVVGDIEPHHFAGFSGGYKSAAIGLAGRPTINHNHALLVHDESTIGVFDANPLRQDIEEIGVVIGVDLALNAVLNSAKEIVAAFFGNPSDVIRSGIPVSRQVCSVPIAEKFDVVIASAGGYPKDINFYQAQKAITHAASFCKKNGVIVLFAECVEGTGSQPYEDFMAGKASTTEVMQAFSKQEFRVGPHKAFQVARLLQSHQIVLVSSIPETLVKALLMRPAGDVQAALDQILHAPSGQTVAILPHATTTMTFQ